ncbi:Hypothetical predicted protein [Octopus vulgaris]|uniref:Uncharacterized protein n=1 Tax=Octopus vulgaris TaxID=6645 RepID=A0AA36ALT7_OCTVU|nr:Hypothetical predicted protein [Octopus vulgaris]
MLSNVDFKPEDNSISFNSSTMWSPHLLLFVCERVIETIALKPSKSQRKAAKLKQSLAAMRINLKKKRETEYQKVYEDNQGDGSAFKKLQDSAMGWTYT